MSVEIQAAILGSEELSATLSAMDARLRDRVRGAVQRTAFELQRKVKADYLTGPRPQRLGVVTGTLRRSINVQSLDTEDQIAASVGTNVWYGRLWELGFTRHGGRTTKSPRSGGSVRTLTNIPVLPRPFLQPALADVRDSFHKRLETAIWKAVGG